MCGSWIEWAVLWIWRHFQRISASTKLQTLSSAERSICVIARRLLMLTEALSSAHSNTRSNDSRRNLTIRQALFLQHWTVTCNCKKCDTLRFYSNTKMFAVYGRIWHVLYCTALWLEHARLWTNCSNSLGLSGNQASGGSKNFEKGGRNTVYQPRRHISQMHTTNFMPFIRKNAAFLKKILSQ